MVIGLKLHGVTLRAHHINMPENLPIAFKKRIKKQFGDKAENFLEALNLPASTSVRINPEKISFKPSLEKIPWSNNGFYINKRPPFVLDPLFHAGCYYVQEASSMLLEEVFRQLQLNEGSQKVLDLCGAPGGKATNILSCISPESLLFTNETIRSRADVLKENIFKWGYHNVVVTNNDPSSYSKFIGYFDVIVVDAPCSGEGLFRKDPAAIEQWSEQNLQLCCDRQQRILHTIWPALKENGILIYSTCTYNPEENERNIERLLKENEAESIPLELTQFDEITAIESNGVHGYYSLPYKTRGEGFFISAIRKKSEVRGFKPDLHRYKKQQKQHIPKEISNLVMKKTSLHLYNDLHHLFPEEWIDNTISMLPMLNVIAAGIPVATIKQKNLIPEPALAMALAKNKDAFHKVELPYPEVLQFLRKETIGHDKMIKGFNLITFKGQGLGWIKMIDGRRSNNYFPREWRIRMELPEELEEIEKLLPLT